MRCSVLPMAMRTSCYGRNTVKGAGGSTTLRSPSRCSRLSIRRAA
jgi:hypothetical protein